MTDRYPYPEIRTNDTIRRLSRETEAGFTRSEYQQVVYCAGEANPTEPIWFGRAYDRPPFFTYSAVAKNNEVVVTPFPCGDVTDRAAGMTIGVAEWIRDPQGMYVGAHLWYKVQKLEVDRAGTGLIQHIYARGSKTITIPDCGQSGDCLILIGSLTGATQADIGIDSPGMGTKNTFGWGAISPTRGSQGAMWNRNWSSSFETNQVITMDNTMTWMVVLLVRGFGCQDIINGVNVNTGVSILEPAIAPAGYPSPVTNTFPVTMHANDDEDFLIALFEGSGSVGIVNKMNDLGILKQVDPGPTLADAQPGFIMTGVASRSEPEQETWNEPFASFDIQTASGWVSRRFRIHQ